MNNKFSTIKYWNRFKAACLCIIILTISQSLFAQLPPPSTNILTNPGFEEGQKDWRKFEQGWSISTNSHSGSASLKITNNNPSSYYPISTELPALSNCRYHLSSWVKAENVTGGTAFITLEYYDSNWKYISSKFPAGVKGTTGWVYIEATTNKIPSNAAYMRFEVVLSKGAVGTAYFDDASVEILDEAKVDYFLQYPKNSSRIYKDMPKKFNLSFVYDENPYHPGSAVNIDAKVLNQNGETISNYSLKPAKYLSRSDLNINAQGFAQGNYRVQMTAIDQVKKLLLQQNTFGFQIVNDSTPTPTVSFDEYNRCVIDGKFFFPLGLYFAGNNDLSDLDTISAGGFNVILNYSTMFWEPYKTKQYMDELQSRNLKMIFSLADCYVGNPSAPVKVGDWVGPYDVFKGWINTLKTHPALLAWYINDEKSGSFLPQIEQNYNYASSNDQNHPVYQVLFKGQDFVTHLKSTDVMGIDNYPVIYKKSEPPALSDFGGAVKWAQDTIQKSKPMWAVAECSTYKQLPTCDRPATYQEMLCESYQALVNGARGIIFWAFYRTKSDDGPAQILAVQNVGKHLRSLEYFAMGLDVSSEKQVTAGNAKVSVLTRKSVDDLWMLAVNPYYESNQVVYSIPTALGQFSSVEVGLPGKVSKTITISNNTFSDNIDVLGCRMYHLKK